MSGNSARSPPPPRRRHWTRSIVTDSSTRRGSAVDVGLSSPPRLSTSASALPLWSRSIAMDSSSERGSTVDVGLSSPPPSPPRTSAAALIDVEVVDDDEVQFLSSSRGSPQPRNQTRRRNRPVIVVVDEEREIPSEPSVRRPSPNCPNKRPKLQIKSTAINCESSSTSEDRRASIPEPKKVVPKVATFSCPICMGTIVNPCSTICGHIFCESCLKAAVQVQKKCPTCRTKLTNKSFHRVFLPVTTKD